MFRNLSISTKAAIYLFSVFILSLFSFYHLLSKTHEQNLISQGRSIADQIVIFRKWSADFGGLWTKSKYSDRFGYLMEIVADNVTEKTYRTGEVIGNKENVHFYLHNPALATRELSSLTSMKYGWTFKVVSDRYMAPEDKPDKWEFTAIEKIKRDPKFSKLKEYWGWDGNKFRFAKAIFVKPGCLKCHGREEEIPADIMKALKAKYGDNVKRAINYKVGELRGIISVTILPSNMVQTVITDVDIWTVGSIVLAFLIFWIGIRRDVVKPIEELTRITNDISLGKLDVDLGVKGLREEQVNNEILKLKIAIDRLRTSIQIAMNRLKKR